CDTLAGGALLSSQDCDCFLGFLNLTKSTIRAPIMIPGLISQELQEQLLDVKNYQNRTNGVEELKHILSEVDIKSVPSASIEDFIKFLPRLLDDSNFKVFYSTLQVLNLFIRKLDTGVDRYFKHIVLVALKALGDTRTVTRNEYLNVFRQLMKTVPPQQILDLVIGHLKHKNSRVREDVLSVIMAAMLTHPRKDFSIPKLCFEVAPYLADSKRRVRHAALELFAIFDHCLDVGKKQPLVEAVDMVELNEDAEGLMAAVQARRARRILPKLSSEGIVEYGLVVLKPGQRCSPQHGSGADLDWVLNGGRISSARSNRTEPDCDRLYGYGSLGSLTDDLPLQRRIVSAGKGKNKLPWEMSSFSSTENDQQQCSTPNGKCADQVDVERTFSLPSNSTTSSSFLLPSYPLATLPGGMLPPTLSHRHADSSLSMSNTWPNKKDNSPHQRESSPWRETASTAKACISFVICLQMLNSLRSLRNSAAKKRAKVSLSSPDPDSPDSAVKVDLGLDSPSYTSPVLTSSTSESGLSSLSSVANSSFNGIKNSPPTVPPNSRNVSRLRRAPSLSRTRPSLSHSSGQCNTRLNLCVVWCLMGHLDELSPGTMGHRKNLSDPPELCPFSKPDLALIQSFNLLNSEDWKKKIEGLTFLRSLAHYHSDTLQAKLHDVCLCLIQEVKNLRSGVSRVAVCTLGDLYTHLHRAMDQELEGTVKALLQKAGESNAFIRQDVDAALDCMVQHCTPTRSINALLTGGLSHLNAVVRKCTAQHLANLVEKVGAARLLSGAKDLTDRILPAVTKLAQDSSQEARYFGRRMLLSLSSHPEFEKILEKYIPTKDLQTVRETVFTIKTKGLGEMPQDTQSARGRRSLPGSGTVRASSLNREPLNQTNRESHSHYSCRSQTQSIADKTEYIKQISGLLGSKDFRERIKGIKQLVADCQHNPNMVFDAFRARLQESNSKVNLCALESLQKIIHLLKDNLSQVVNILVPAIVDNHLNSKNNAIYSAAIEAINALLLNLDSMLLLQPFCTKAQFLSGKGKVDLIEKVADLVTELYPRKPQMVEQKVLPLLWHLLGTSTHSGTIHGRGGSVRGATANLCQALYAQMGPSLSECAASQPANVHKSLNDILRTLS
uniref:TOG array regulator of axonemal microtubules 1 n=1 Tax=Amphilophus citrinellus TaxID=61819 RepID=A0A3Q0SGZ9_AMPCI